MNERERGGEREREREYIYPLQRILVLMIKYFVSYEDLVIETAL